MDDAVKEKLKALISQLQTEFQGHIANANAAKGAIQACEHLLNLPEDEKKTEDAA